MAAMAMPSPRIMQAMLREITERLAAELDRPSAMAPDWSETHWRVAQAVAAIHGIAPLLAARGQAWRAPDAWSNFLAAQHAHTHERQKRIVGLLHLIDARARDSGIALMGLKGAALHARGLYAAGERPTADLDLLAPASELDAAARLLRELGYREVGATWKHRMFQPQSGTIASALGEHADNPIHIDLHGRIAERLPLVATDFTDLIVPPQLRPGVGDYPSTAALMLHVLAHAAGTLVHRGLRLIQLEDIVRIAARMDASDWRELLGYRGRERRLWWAAPPLLLAARYFPGRIASWALDELTRDCPRPLQLVSRRRELTDVSYSHAFIDPIPGIVWTRSPRGLLAYLLSRVRLSPEQRSQMQVLAGVEPWASQRQWFEQSHWRRLLCWLTSRPMRPETVQPVRAALGHIR
jgi:hypothetical protein